MTPGLPQVLVLGCGFGGLAAARALANAPVRVTVVDRTNHHLFQPLLYQVATAGLAAPAIAAPIRQILRTQQNATVLLGDALAIDPAQRLVSFADGSSIAYDHLIIATGANHSYFGHDDWARFAPGLKTLEDALEIRRRVLLAYECAEREPDPVARASWLSFVVIGAGATGVELAGTLAEIARHTLSGEFRHFDPRSARVLLVEGAPHVLPAYPDDLSDKARAQLEKLGVEVRTACRVTGIDGEGVTISDARGEERIAARTVVWAAGVAASPLGRSLSQALGLATDRAGRVPVEPDLSVPGHPEIVVIGDLAALSCDGQPVPGVCPAAKQMGAHAGRNLIARLAGRPARPFRYFDYGMLATIGRKAAVVKIGKLKISGLPAWLFWLFVHIYFLIGFRNRLVVMIDWAWAYFSFQRYARIVISARDALGRMAKP